MASAAVDVQYIDVARSDRPRRAAEGVRTHSPLALSERDIWAGGVGAAGRSAASWVGEAMRRVRRLMALAENWDSYGAAPVATAAVLRVNRIIRDAATNDLPRPAIVPTTTGGLQVEWHLTSYDLELRVSDDGSVMSVYEDTPAGVIELENPSDTILRAAFTRLLVRILAPA